MIVLLLIVLIVVLVGFGAIILFVVFRDSVSAYRSSRALQQAKDELKRNPSSLSAMKTAANLYYQQEDWIDAHHAYRRLYGDRLSATMKLPHEFEQGMQYAIAAYNSKDVDHAYLLLKQLRQFGTQSFEYHKYLGLCAYRSRNFNDALSVLRKAQQLKPTDIEVCKYIAFSQYHLGDMHEARIMLKTIKDVDSDLDAQFILGNIYLRQGEHAQAVRVFSKLAKRDSHMLTALIALGDAFNHQGDMPRALEYYRRASRLTGLSGTPLEIELLYKMSILLLQTGKSSVALKHLIKIDQSQPNYKDVRQKIKEINFSAKNKGLTNYLQADNRAFRDIVNSVIPLLLQRRVSGITPLEDSRNAFYDYGVTIASVDGRRSESVLIRFARTQTDIHEEALRGLYEKMTSGRFARGFFVTAGRFSVGARRFASERTITLCDAERLNALLERVAV